jgi:hypothetical protein
LYVPSEHTLGSLGRFKKYKDVIVAGCRMNGAEIDNLEVQKRQRPPISGRHQDGSLKEHFDAIDVEHEERCAAQGKIPRKYR